MIKKINRRKIFYLNKKNLIYLFVFLALLTIFTITFYNKLVIYKYIYGSIEHFSATFNYQFVNLNITGIENVKKETIESKLQIYFNSSIFLLPLAKINEDIQNNNWIKSVNLKTNYKDTLNINIIEHKPFAIYSYNKKNFFIDTNGKIFDQVKNNHNPDLDLLVFEGNLSNLNAKSIINVLQNLNFQKKFKITQLIFINKRRWNIFINNNRNKLMLSETDPKKSLENFIKIEKNLSKAELNNIKIFDLRNTRKTLLEYY